MIVGTAAVKRFADRDREEIFQGSFLLNVSLPARLQTLYGCRFKRFRDSTEFVSSPEGVTFLAGGNNSGKSALLQALAVWEFARSVIEISKKRSALSASALGQDVGVSAEEFSPIALPNLRHLWSDLHVPGGHAIRIRCDRQVPAAQPLDRHLEFALALSNDRLFLKRADSNLADEDGVPRLAYFAAIRRHQSAGGKDVPGCAHTVKLFIGLGSQYAPRLDQLKRCKRLFLHDGRSDLEILQAWASTLGYGWPENLVCWKYTKNREARQILFDELRAEIPELKLISCRTGRLSIRADQSRSHL